MPSNPHKGPLYWSVYEHHIVKEQNGVKENYIPESVLMANVDWVDANLKSLGYNMICMDGWGDVTQLNENGYRKSHSSKWEHDFAWWSTHLQGRGMTLGMYGNPLWVHVADNDQTTKIKGTNILVSSLKNSSENAYFPWVQVDRPGAEEYVKGYIQYYADLGIKYFRVDFLSWYETGQDRYLGRVGPSRPREHYLTALKWMKEAADANGMFLSLVMPHLTNEAEAEVQYGHMFRINEDTGEGKWWKWSDNARGEKRVGWSVYANAMDGLTYWSYLAGRNKVILDPDFLRINTFSGNDEKKSVISASIISGGAVTVSDQYNTIGPDLWLYQNKELLALRQDGFVGKPLTNDPTQENSQIWTGQLSNGDWIIGLFNRETSSKTRSINFSTLGITGSAQVRDLWSHSNLGGMTSYSTSVPAHGCVILKVVPGTTVPQDEASVHVASLVTGTQATTGSVMKGTAMVIIQDKEGNPVNEAPVSVSFSGSFTETVTGTTNAQGTVVLTTNATATGVLKVNACVTNVSHPSAVYDGGMNAVNCRGEYMFVAGTFSSWNLTLNPMQWNNGQWEVRNLQLTAGEHELKFANTNNWSGNDWGNATGLTGTASLTTGGAPNIKFTIAKAGLYTISFNEQTLAYAIKGQHQEKMFVGGTFNNWTLGNTPMILEDDVWKASAVQISAGNHELKFANTDNWSGDDWADASGLTGTAKLSTGGKPNLTFSVAQSGQFDISFNDLTLAYSISPKVLTSIRENLSTETDLRVYPNPVQDRLFIRVPKRTGEIQILTMLGKSVSTLSLNGKEELSVDTSILPNGIYLIRFSGKGNVQLTRKVMVVK
ncbi:T9SS type A sorting domain-containing protein [Rufibacter sediminis]|uniref:T9SS type A sorting domain-containing protein n=1 Tax=Rufibacter sediminis TaxID=2762756 RepID=A0ABR6VP93_9BACT|nr:T9SS type A sorting domain-containing protein [Rufibacter sediminis]MBC3538977.1 T9SS type A sorting domain-containing protein [Rufibacter sediminis]